jgi:hypothetical protein
LLIVGQVLDSRIVHEKEYCSSSLTTEVKEKVSTITHQVIDMCRT